MPGIGHNVSMDCVTSAIPVSRPVVSEDGWEVMRRQSLLPLSCVSQYNGGHLLQVSKTSSVLTGKDYVLDSATPQNRWRLNLGEVNHSWIVPCISSSVSAELDGQEIPIYTSSKVLVLNLISGQRKILTQMSHSGLSYLQSLRVYTLASWRYPS